MKKWLLASLALVMLLMVGCTATIYGVPQERWDVMSEQERISAMEAYKARQAVLQERMREQARQRALMEEARLAREAEEARYQQMQIDAIYRGEGAYGDLLRVTLHEGSLKFRGAHKPYHPVSFKIAAGEIKDIKVVSRRGYQATLLASYDGSNLLLDEARRSHRDPAVRLPFDDDWGWGTTYTDIHAKGPLELRGVSATVEIVGRRPRSYHARRRPQIIVIERPAPQPQKPVVIIKDKPRSKKPVVVVKEKPQANQTVVVVKERPKKDKTVVIVKEKPAVNQPVVVVEPPKAKKPGAIRQRHNAKAAETAQRVVLPNKVTVAFREGKIKVAGKHGKLVPQSIDLHHGEVRTLTLKSKRGAVKVQVSYLSGEVLIDDRPGKNSSKTIFSYDQKWTSGQSYKLEKTSHQRLEDLDILILAK